MLTFARTPVYEMHVSSDYLSNSAYEDLEPACTSSCLIVVCTKNPTILSTRIRLSSLPVNCRDAERRVALCPFDNLPAFSLGKGPAAHSIAEVDDLSFNHQLHATTALVDLEAVGSFKVTLQTNLVLTACCSFDLYTAC